MEHLDGNEPYLEKGGKDGSEQKSLCEAVFEEAGVTPTGHPF